MEHLEKNIFMDNTRLELKSIYKNFGSVIALKNISMTTESGQINCILGDNGAGKSTLVNIISGDFKPTKGEFKINDKNVSFLNPLEAIKTLSSENTDTKPIKSDQIFEDSIIVLHPDGTYRKYSQKS